MKLYRYYVIHSPLTNGFLYALQYRNVSIAARQDSKASKSARDVTILYILNTFSFVRGLVSVRVAPTVTRESGNVLYARTEGNTIVKIVSLVTMTGAGARDVTKDTVEPVAWWFRVMFADTVSANTAVQWPTVSPSTSAARRTVCNVEIVTIVTFVIRPSATTADQVSGAKSATATTAVKVTT